MTRPPSPHPVFTHNPRIAELLNSYQILYMLGLVEASAVDPVALGAWLDLQSPNFDVAAYSQTLLQNRGLKSHWIIMRDPSQPQLRDGAQPQASGGNARTFSYSDLAKTDTRGWFMLVRDLDPDWSATVVIYATTDRGYQAYHPLRGLITITRADLSRFGITTIMAWHLPASPRK